MSGLSGGRVDARAAAWIQGLALVTILSALAILSAVFFHGRTDLTRDRLFTPDTAVTETLQGLRDKVTVRVVMSRDLPDEFARVRMNLVDVLREFEARSNGHLHVVIDNPDRDSLARVTALSLGLEEIVFRSEERAGVKARKGFFGLALIWRDHKEVITVLRSAETFEYDFMVHLKRLTGALKTVGVIEGAAGQRFEVRPPSGEPAVAPGFEAQFSGLRARVDPLYRIVKPGSGTDSAGVPYEMKWDRIPDILLVTAPRRLDSAEAAGIEAFMHSGKPVVFLKPGLNVDLAAGIDLEPSRDSLHATLSQDYSDELLARYGIAIAPALLIDPLHGQAVRFGEEESARPYPWWIQVDGGVRDGLNPDLSAGLNENHPVTAVLPSVTFPWISPLLLNPSARPDLRYEVLASTSRQAWAEAASRIRARSLYPDSLPAYVADTTARHGIPRAWPLAVSVTGPHTRLIVISNALFVTDFYAGYGNVESNLQFVLNALDYLALDPSLIRMRSRPLPDAPLDFDRVQRFHSLLISVNLLSIPAAILLLWMLAALFRRRISRGSP